jgi:hypothetical protein
MDALISAAGRLDAAAYAMAEASRALGETGPAAEAFGADAPGRFGELGRALHGRWLAATGERSREAAALGARLSDAASALRVAAAGYTASDERAARRFPASDERFPGVA